MFKILNIKCEQKIENYTYRAFGTRFLTVFSEYSDRLSKGITTGPLGGRSSKFTISSIVSILMYGYDHAKGCEQIRQH